MLSIKSINYQLASILVTTYTINLYQDCILFNILASILVIVIYYHSAQALVQTSIIADITGHKKNTNYLICYSILIHH